MQDFERKVGKDGSTKSKDIMVVGFHVWWPFAGQILLGGICCKSPISSVRINMEYLIILNCYGRQTLTVTRWWPALQKLAQLDDEKQMQLFDVCCLWVYLQPKIKENFPGSVLQKYDQMFLKGILGLAHSAKTGVAKLPRKYMEILQMDNIWNANRSHVSYWIWLAPNKWIICKMITDHVLAIGFGWRRPKTC